MKKTIYSILLLLLTCVVPLLAKGKKNTQKPPVQKVYLLCNALTTSYTYSELYGKIAGDLTNNNCILVHSADDADWTIQVVGTVQSQQKTDFGATTFYSTEVSVNIMIDRWAFSKRVFETTLIKQGKHTMGFDEAAEEAYKILTPQIFETIKLHIQ